jgi:hypothetical protein
VRDVARRAPLDARSLEADLRILLGGEEVVRAQVLVAIGDPGVDARGGAAENHQGDSV